MLDKIRIVMVETSHPGNIGAAARAMKNMGLKDLYLVKPEIFPHVDATARAVGADELLENAHVVDTLDEALIGCKLVIGTSARSRALPMSVLSPRQGAEMAYKESNNYEVAIVFGRESSGLTNEELRKSHYQLFVPTVEGFSSLNLASAILLIAYELRLVDLEKRGAINNETSELPKESVLASADEVENFFDHLFGVISRTDFLPEKNHNKLLLRIRRIFTRTRLEKKEVDILRGILSSIEKGLKD